MDRKDLLRIVKALPHHPDCRIGKQTPWKNMNCTCGHSELLKDLLHGKTGGPTLLHDLDHAIRVFEALPHTKVCNDRGGVCVCGKAEGMIWLLKRQQRKT